MQIMKNKKVILISSSTGGHALPLLEIYHELEKQNLIPTIFHSGSEIEREIFSGLRKRRIITGKLHRGRGFSNIFQAIKLVFGLIESFFLLIFVRPALIFSKGGFCAVPVLSVAKLFAIPYFLHESDSVIGLTNMLFLKNAKKAFLSFPLDQYEEKLGANVSYSGLIIRKSFLNAKNRPRSKGQKPTIFITGGSQGASIINKIVFEILPTLLSDFRVIHQVGIHDLDKALAVQEKLSGESVDYEVFDFSFKKAENAFVGSELVICRAGANTIGELAALSKASILIPYRYAASDHQQKNARYLEKSNAAILIREDNLTSKVLLERVKYLFSNPKNIETLGKNCSKIIKHDGLNFVTEEIVKFIKG